MTWKDGEELPPGLAKAEVEAMLRDPQHTRDKGSKDDLNTVDDPLPEGDEE